MSAMVVSFAVGCWKSAARQRAGNVRLARVGQARGRFSNSGGDLVVTSGGSVLVAFFEAPGREALGDGRGQPDFSVGTAKEKEIRARTYVFAPSRLQD